MISRSTELTDYTTAMCLDQLTQVLDTLMQRLGDRQAVVRNNAAFSILKVRLRQSSLSRQTPSSVTDSTNLDASTCRSLS